MNEEYKYRGIYRAVVKDNKDPKNLRRLKVVVPQITGDSVSNWIWPVERTPVTFELPEVGKGVWVFYVGGDPEYPIWMDTFGLGPSNGKKTYIKVLLDSVDISALLEYLILITQPDGKQELDLIDTLIVTAETLKDHEERITALEARMTTAEANIVALQALAHSH